MGHLISPIVPLLLVWSNSGPDSPFAGTHLRVARERKRARTFMRALLANVLVMATQALVVSGSLLGLFRRAAPVRELGRQDVCPPQYFGHTLLCSTPELAPTRIGARDLACTQHTGRRNGASLALQRQRWALQRPSRTLFASACLRRGAVCVRAHAQRA